MNKTRCTLRTLGILLLVSACAGTNDPGAECPPCDDGDPCTQDLCVDGMCVHEQICACRTDADCEDDNECTLDTCLDGHCQQEYSDQACDDGDACTQADHCSEGGCRGDPLDCDDGNPCTDDACDNASGCIHTPNSAGCDDGDPCTENDRCQEGQCLGDDICGECSPVPEPDPVPLSALPGETAPGRSESTTINGFQDDYVYDSSNSFKIGTRQEWGGTIIFFGQNVNDWPGRNNTNTIDANDTGREVQVAFYDPDRAMQNCAHDATCASQASECPFSITYLGWNPVQGGNRCNRGSGVESVVSADGVQTLSTRPLFWNPNWDREDCSDAACSDPSLRDRRSDVRVEQRIRFVRPLVAEIEYSLTNLGDLDHRSTAQEMPTVYTANGDQGPDLWRLFNSQGQEISIDVPGNDGFFYKNYSSPGGWSCMQNTNLDYGVGLLSENRLSEAQGWQNRGLPFNNFRPLFHFAIPARGTVKARAYLLLGSLETISAEAAWLDAHLAPFGWLDSPQADESVAGDFRVAGWVLDNKGVQTVEAIIDGGQATPLSLGSARPDVCLVWPAYPACPNVGFSGDLSAQGLSDCQHLLEIRATDSDGNARVIARRRFRVGG